VVAAKARHDPWRKKHLDPGELSETDHRKHRILDALFKALEAAKASVRVGERGEILAVVARETVEVRLREKLKQIKRPLTEDEKRFSFNRDRGWLQEPKGILCFSIKTYLYGKLRSEWADSSKNSLEEFLPEVLATILAAGPLLAEQRRDRERGRTKETDRRTQTV
jgi:hypothetical protein